MSIFDHNGVNLDSLYQNINNGENYGNNIPLIRYAIFSLNYDAVAYLHSCVNESSINILKEYKDIKEYKLIWYLFCEGYFSFVLHSPMPLPKPVNELFITDLDILEPRLSDLYSVHTSEHV